MSDERFPDSDESRVAPDGHSAEPSAEGATPTSVDSPPNDPPREYGGRKGPNPVRYGDWEKNGRCIDF